MSDNKVNSIVTGRREAMEPFGTRIPPGEAATLRKAAKKYGCNCADLLRTAWSEWIANHAAELA